MKTSVALLPPLARVLLRQQRRQVRSAARSALALRWFMRDLDALMQQEAESSRRPVIDLNAQLSDKTSTTGFDAHYVQQGPWVFRHLLDAAPDRHVDVGSFIGYLPFFSAVVPTTFIDIRPSGLIAPGLVERAGSILDLPFADGELQSVSSLHVIEHIGLGRYGDPVDADGSRRACAELARVVAPKGHLYLSAPVGRSRVCFNAHRVHSVTEIIEACADLQLVGLDAVLDDGTWVQDCDPSAVADADYALGLFRFTRPTAAAATT